MKALGISKEQVKRQLEIFKKSSFSVFLERYCSPNDGVQTVPFSDTSRYFLLHDQAVRQGRFSKFVPASGAATRMFQSLLQIYHMPQYLVHDELMRRAEAGVAVACDFMTFLEGLSQFAFLEDLDAAMMHDGLSLQGVIRERQFRVLLEYLLTERGLNLGSIPKGLLKFHKYPQSPRTAFEEHMAEAMHYAQCGTGKCTLHFTIAPEYESAFRLLAERACRDYEKQFGVCFEICFSFQKASTNTIAVDMHNQPFRDRQGRLLFRPGGHGALIENLNELQGDLIYIKNIDNVIPDRIKDPTTFWKKVLGGVLIDIQSTVHNTIRELLAGASPEILDRADRFAREKLLIQFPAVYYRCSLEEKQAFLLEELNRPIRVCGVVENIGEPGGAPFWVKDRKGALSLQIVEKAQVDVNSTEQARIWKSSTHFNPVDIVCAVRDFEGKAFDLRKFVDPEAVFITKKSKDGQDIKALELPGLWNGAMADWITIVVDVPRITFNPVKTIYDLLRPEHLP